MSLTISLSPTHIPLLFLFFLYFFHCLLLPLHSPINTSLFFSSQHTILLIPFFNIPFFNTPFFNRPLYILVLVIHIFHSLVLRFPRLQRGGEGVITIITSHILTSPSPSSTCLHGLDCLRSRIQDFVASRSSCYSYGVFRLSL